MREYRANDLKRKNWWAAWTDDLPGALTQGKTLEEAREDLRGAVQLMREPIEEGQMPR
jgi:predicted RNase H-like HicB family nuclease